MKVMKFGGTSVGSPERMKGVCRLITKSGEPTFVVLSAMSGTTNSLIEISNYFYKKNPDGAHDVINTLERKYMRHIDELYTDATIKAGITETVKNIFQYLRSFSKDTFTSFEERAVVAQGEMLSTNMVVAYLKQEGIKAILIPALDFMRNNDPRVVEHTEPVHQLNFEEAAELAYFGAKILHPTCVQPAKNAGIPVALKNTMDPDAEGTIINNDLQRGKIKAVAAKDNITAIKIKSSRMLLASGFLRKVFDTFEEFNTSIDMVCTSEVGVSMSIDNPKNLEAIVDKLKKYGTVTVDRGMCIICVVGDLDWENLGFETLATEAMKDIPVRMISYGGSNYNISYLIREEDKKRALQNLSAVLFK